MKPQSKSRFLLFVTLTFAWMAVIFLFSAQNGEESSGMSAKLLSLLSRVFRFSPSPDAEAMLSFLVRKAAHMTEFGVLALLWLGTLCAASGKAKWTYPAAFVLSSVYAATDEFHQLFVSGRAGRVTDWLIDSSGAVLFLWFGWAVIQMIGNKNTKSKG